MMERKTNETDHLSDRSVRVLLADDHPMTRAGLVAWLEKEEGIELVAQAVDGEEAWRHLEPETRRRHAGYRDAQRKRY